MSRSVAIANYVQRDTFRMNDQGPVVDVYRRGGDRPVSLAKVAERNHCPRRTGAIYVSLPSEDRERSDRDDASHPSKRLILRLEMDDGEWQEIPQWAVENVAIRYDPGFTYCMTCVDGDAEIDPEVFGKEDPVVSVLNIDPTQFAFVAGHSLGSVLGIERIAVVHGRVRYLDYEARDRAA